MEGWKKVTYMVAFYMFVIELQPLEPFMTAYQIGPDVNVSISEVANVLEAIKTYSALFVSIIMLITADYLLYKPNIIFVTVWTCLSYFYMTNSPSLIQTRVSTVGIGAMYTCTPQAYSYLCAQIDDTDQLQMAISIVTAIMELGKVAGDLLGQLIVNVTGGSYTVLPYCNVVALFLGVIWACLFPSVKRKSNFLNVNVVDENSWIFEYSKENTKEQFEKNKSDINKKQNVVAIVLKEVWLNFTISFSDPLVLKSSIWYIFGMAAYILVLSNINVLYTYVTEKSNNHDVLLHGLAEAMVTICGAAGAYLIGKVRLDWNYYGDVFTAICSIFMGILMMSCYIYNHIYLIYLSYILFSFVFQSNFVIKQTEVTKNLKNQCYSLVLEFNYIVALIIVNIVTLFLLQFNVMSITIPGRFLFIGGLFVVLGIAFMFNCMIRRSRPTTLY